MTTDMKALPGMLALMVGYAVLYTLLPEGLAPHNAV